MTLKARRGGLAARLLLCCVGAVLGCLLAAGSAAAAPPANDAFASAEVLTGTSDSATGTNVQATKQTGEPNHAFDPGGASVWYVWTAPSSGTFKLDTCASNFDTLLAVYTGSAVNALTEVASNDQGFHCGDQSELAFHAVNATTYHIAVDGWSDFGATPPATGNIGLNLQLATPPSNDNFSSALALLSVTENEVEGSNAGATKEAGEPNHDGDLGGASVWYTWTAPVTGDIRVDICITDFDALGAVYTGSAVNSLTQIASGNCQFVFHAVQGTHYMVAVDGSTEGGTTPVGVGNFLLATHLLSPPPNDNFASAQALSGSSARVTGTNVDAFGEAGEPGHFLGGPFASVWFSWVAPASGQVTIDTCASNFDTVLAVYTGNAVNSLSLIVSNDDSAACGAQSQVTFAANAGVTYRIAVDGYFETGAIDLRLAQQIAQLAPRDSTPPQSRIREVIVDSQHGKATVKFGSSEPGSSFRCKLDGKPFRPCHSPKTYRHLDAGKHKVKVEARDAAGNLDRTPAVRSFKIKP